MKPSLDAISDPITGTFALIFSFSSGHFIGASRKGLVNRIEEIFLKLEIEPPGRSKVSVRYKTDKIFVFLRRSLRKDIQTIIDSSKWRAIDADIIDVRIETQVSKETRQEKKQKKNAKKEMVHSALKPTQSSEEPHEEAPLVDTPAPNQTSQGSTTTGVSETLGIWEPLQDGPEDPRPMVLALLGFVSEIELFELFTRRVAHARPYGPPLYLTPYCIEGMHDFFIPNRSPMDSLLEPLAAECPFSKIPRLRIERHHLTMDGRVTGHLLNEGADAMLVSLATLLHFLSPQELQKLIRSRVLASEAPHEGVRWFMEFMTSGGDGVPRGKLDLDEREAKSIRKEEQQRRDNATKPLPDHLPEDTKEAEEGELCPEASISTGQGAVLPPQMKKGTKK